MFGFRRRAELNRSRKEDKNNNLLARLVTVLDPANSASEAYRTLRTNLLYSIVDEQPPKVITLTSPGPREGKSTTCANLGVVLAQMDKNVIMLDCDLRKPVVHKVFGLRNLHGVVDVLAGQRDLQEVWQEDLPGLKIVTVGSIPPNPAELLGSRRFADLLDQVRQEFDYVLLDAPPVELVTDPLVLASQSDGVLLVLDAQNTRKASFRRSMRSLETIDANVLGTVMNNVKSLEGGYYYGESRYYNRYSYR